MRHPFKGQHTGLCAPGGRFWFLNRRRARRAALAHGQVFLTSTHLGIAMEYASGGELFDRIVKANRFSEDEARYFFQQLISGVAWCHREVGAAPAAGFAGRMCQVQGPANIVQQAGRLLRSDAVTVEREKQHRGHKAVHGSSHMQRVLAF